MEPVSRALARITTTPMPQQQSVDIVVGVVVLLLVLFVRIIVRGERIRRERMEALLSGVQALSAEEFMRYAQPSTGEVTGVYVLHNIARDKYYVGQSKCVLNRVRHHLTGSGNGDVYADYRYGDAFEVMVISCTRAGYESINALERDLIAHYDAYTKGYNKNAGNRG